MPVQNGRKPAVGKSLRPLLFVLCPSITFVPAFVIPKQYKKELSPT